MAEKQFYACADLTWGSRLNARRATYVMGVRRVPDGTNIELIIVGRS